MTALLLIGMQVDLLPGGPAEVPDSQSLVAVLNQIIPTYDLVVAANFSLPADHVMFAANHLWRKPRQTIHINGHPTLLHPIFCVPGSFGAEMIPGLKTEKIAYTALMGTDRQVPPHSAFFDFGKKRDTGLATFLASQNVTELHIAGMPMETEVQHSLEAAISLGINASLLTEACRCRLPSTVNPQPSTNLE
ncbi:MAG: isochorismatase family protein [Saprospiraceae bacterium]|nr:isochorismatase family protein [Saprospiraceae bacterium]